MLSRVQCALLVLLCCVTLVGCGGVGGDWLWWPSFHYYPTAYTSGDVIPVHDVALEVQCEIYRFLDDENANKDHELLDPTKGAGVALILQTDLTGSVQYVGVDLKKLGFPNLAELVAASNKVPSLQAKAQGVSTISAEVDFTVAQYDPILNKPARAPPTVKPHEPPKPPNMALKKSDMSASTPDSPIIYENAEFNQAPGHPAGELFAEGAKPVRATPLPIFPPAECKPGAKNGPAIYQPYLELWLDDWLRRYEDYRERSIQKVPFVCNTKITLKSMFKVLYDVSAGVNAFAAPPIILPISGFNVDASPDYSHSIAISFALHDPTHFPGDQPGGPNHQKYCSTIGPGTQPAVK